ncbi:tetrathionate reductase family octaheme c-type cytochrome [Candidatus Kapaibacterium sp.]
MKTRLIIASIIVIAGIIVSVAISVTKSDKVDHSELVSGPFETPQDVTRACIGCHEDQAAEVLKSRHWLWHGDEFEVEGKGKIKFGKKFSFNNFCINIASNEPRCTSCHPGYGWKDDTFDFNNPENIDCLVCHDNSGTYKKIPTGAGMPSSDVDLTIAAQSVGRSKKSNCGSCHFEGGGGTAVKHGDLDPTLLDNSKKVDIHMNKHGLECTSCHKSEKHQILGSSHGSMAQGINHTSCTDCHDDSKKKIHKNATIAKHLNSVACESCHIPSIAREYYTVTYWDWSTAGLKEDVKFDEKHLAYSKLKGDLKWEKDVKPVYRWHNGKADYYLAGDKFDSSPLMLNKLKGSVADAKSKIYPFKLMKGKQIYDTENKYLIAPRLYGEGGFWTNFDWNSASEIGMKKLNLPYSGKFGFVETEMLWPVNHMVVSKGETMKCNDCHGKNGAMDWKALGYNDDPLHKGGRERNKLLK